MVLSLVLIQLPVLPKELNIFQIENLLTPLYLSDSPYEIKLGLIYYRNTNKLALKKNQKSLVIAPP